MRLAHDTHNFGQLPVGLPATWGLAAGAQTQISPGASALAAPPAMLWARTRRACLLTKLLGVLEATVLMGGLAGLVTGMYLLAPSPLPGVMVMLASMTLLLSSVAKLGQAQEGRQQSNAGRELSVRNRVSDCNS